MRLWASFSLTAMLAFTGLACAQDSGCLTIKKISASHHALQQGGDIELSVKLVTGNCSLPIDVKGSKTAELSLQDQEGFQTYLPVVEINDIENPPVSSTWMAHAVTARFALHAFYNASVGEHTIPASLTYTAQDANGNIASHILALNIPVKVIEPPKPGFWDEHSEARKTLVTTGEVLLVIVAMPIMIIGNILGFYHWDC